MLTIVSSLLRSRACGPCARRRMVSGRRRKTPPRKDIGRQKPPVPQEAHNTNGVGLRLMKNATQPVAPAPACPRAGKREPSLGSRGSFNGSPFSPPAAAAAGAMDGPRLGGRGDDGGGRHRFLSTTAGITRLLLAVSLLLPVAGAAHAQSLDSLVERLETLERENRELRKEIEAIKTAQARSRRPAGFVRTEARFGYEILDPTDRINRKERLLLDRKRDGTLAPGGFYLQGAITPVANYQSSNRADKFGYLMRHPTAKNQVGKTVSEAAIHSVQLGVTATLGNWVAGHAQALFDPEQSFGDGTNTSIDRNQLQMRQAWVLFGALDRSPFHASLGKMAVPFGLTDTVNPFTASTVWHAFGGLANGVKAGYASDSLNLTLMGIQGGAQFRAANTPVKGTAVPGRLNNFAVDANYEHRLDRGRTLLLGGSWQRGSAYCQDYPVQHFEPCRDNNPAFGIYGRLIDGPFTFKAEFARTTDVWPGTFNPDMPQFAASKVTAFDLGAKYRLDRAGGPVDLSVEFSRFAAGPGGAPWEKQDQIVLGVAWFVEPSVKLFAEAVRTAGYAPLNFISGGSVMATDGDGAKKVDNTRTHSDRGARSNILLVGANVAF